MPPVVASSRGVRKAVRADCPRGEFLMRSLISGVILLCATTASTAEAQDWDLLADESVAEVPDVDPGTMLFDTAANELRRFHSAGSDLNGFAFTGTAWETVDMLAPDGSPRTPLAYDEERDVTV